MALVMKVRPETCPTGWCDCESCRFQINCICVKEDRRSLSTQLLHSYMPMDREQRESANEVFKGWLRNVGLPSYQSYGKGGVPISATESIRRLLITLVDEP